MLKHFHICFVGSARNTHTYTHTYTSWFVCPSNGLCPILQISYSNTPKLHTSLAVEYFL